MQKEFAISNNFIETFGKGEEISYDISIVTKDNGAYHFDIEILYFFISSEINMELYSVNNLGKSSLLRSSEWSNEQALSESD